MSQFSISHPSARGTRVFQYSVTRLRQLRVNHVSHITVRQLSFPPKVTIQVKAEVRDSAGVLRFQILASLDRRPHRVFQVKQVVREVERMTQHLYVRVTWLGAPCISSVRTWEDVVYPMVRPRHVCRRPRRYDRRHRLYGCPTITTTLIPRCLWGVSSRYVKFVCYSVLPRFIRKESKLPRNQRSTSSAMR